MIRTRLALPLAALLACACSVPVASGLEDTDANQVVVALENGGIVAQKEADPAVEAHFQVTVARDDASAAVGILSRENLPPPSTPGVLESLGEGSLVPSRTAEHAKLIAGTAGELERSLRAIDGVLSARVHLAVAAKGPLGDDADAEPSASVLVRHRGPAPPIAPAEVQRLVAGAVPGLDEKRVKVVLSTAPAAARPAERELSRIGPITVTRASLTPLKLVIGAAALLNVVLILLLGVLFARVRRAQSELIEARMAADAAKPAQ